jgi:hypothetical protein
MTQERFSTGGSAHPKLTFMLNLLFAMFGIIIYTLLIRQLLDQDDRLRGRLRGWWQGMKAWLLHQRRQQDRETVEELLRDTKPDDVDPKASA